jgi:DNA-binding LacI/PurR family transcriptional regulator
MQGEKERLVIDYLTDKIQSGKYREGSRIPSEYQLAEKLGVNKGTANRAVASLVSKGYLLRTKGAGGTVVLRNQIFPKHNFGYAGIMGGPHSYYPLLLRGLSEMAFLNDCGMTCVNINMQTNIDKLSQNLRNLKLDALFVGGTTPTFELPDIPVIFIDSYPFNNSSDKVRWINSANYQAGQMLAEFLHRKGHSQLAFAQPPNPIKIHRDRFEGARDKCLELGVSLIPVYFAEAETMSSSPFFFEKIKKQIIGRQSAVIFDYDIVAADFIGFCAGCGVRVPEDISVAAFGGNQEFHHFYKISSVDLHPEDIGRYAAMMALDILSGKQDVPQEENLPVSLIEGETVASL